MTVVIIPPPSLCTPIFTLLPPQRAGGVAQRRHDDSHKYITPATGCANDVMWSNFRLGDHAESLSRIITVAYQNRQFLLAALMPHFTLYRLCANLNVEIGYG